MIELYIYILYKLYYINYISSKLFGREMIKWRYLSRRLGNLANALDTYTVGTQRHAAICGKVAVGDKNSKAISVAAG